MSGITTQLRRLLVALLALGMFASVSAPTASAQTSLVGQFYEEQELVDVNRAAAYLGMDMQTFAQAAAEVHYFLLAIAEKLNADECLLGYGSSIVDHSGHKVTWFEYPGELGAKFDSVMTHYCLNVGQAQRFNLALLTFLVGANAAQGGIQLPAVGAPSHSDRTNGYDETPPEGWGANFSTRLGLLTRHDLTTSDQAACVGGGHAGYESDIDALYWDIWAHGNHAEESLLLQLDLLIANLAAHLDAACTATLEAQLDAAGTFRFFTFNAAFTQSLHLGLQPATVALDTLPITHPFDPELSVWDLALGLIAVFLEPGFGGLHGGSCSSEDESFYLDIHPVTFSAHFQITDYIAAETLAPDVVDALLEAAELFNRAASQLTVLHESVCRPPQDRDAAIVTVGLLAEILFELGRLASFGSFE